MVTLFLIRHGQPDTGLVKGPVCLGRKDLPLSHEGEKQAARLAFAFRKIKLDAIYSSPLVRCQKTAAILGEKSGNQELQVKIVPAFTEVDTGEWDGLSFKEIREKYPDQFEERGRHLGTFVIPGGEALKSAGDRFYDQFMELIAEEKTAGNKGEATTDRKIAIVSHAGVIQSFLCRITGKNADNLRDFNIPYASVTTLNITDGEGTGKLTVLVETVGLKPVESISLSEVDRMWGENGVEPPLRAHMEAVADTAMNLIGYDLSLVRGDLLDTAYDFQGTSINVRLLYFAALLHDVARATGMSFHAENGAAYLRKQGYLEIAETVKPHHDAAVWKENEPLSEAEILYYADKLVQGDRLVTLRERFERSRDKCKTEEAVKNHELRYQAALGIERKMGI